MIISHVIGIFSPEHGGPVVSCRNYALEQARVGHDIMLRTVEGYAHTGPALRLPPPVDEFVGQIDSPQKLGRSRDLRRALRHDRPADVYHLHGIWLRAMYYGYEKARQTKRPYLIEINGALDPLELRSKPWRKTFVRRWFQDRMLHEAPCLHVNSLREATHLRALGFAAPIATIAAGFNVAEFDALRDRSLAAPPEWAARLSGRRVLLYLARIHRAKGIDDLLLAWASAAPKFPEWDLLIVGPGEAGEIERRKLEGQRLGIEHRCLWTGLVSDLERAWAYAKAELYVLPSHKENFGNTVQEALGSGTAVITTNQTPWLDLEQWGCGWVCSDSAASLGQALTEALALAPSQLRLKGENGREVILRDFSLTKVIRDQIAVYQWLNGGPLPDCVTLH